ncbi:MAG TPA: GAF domain-containing protein [Usitatibacteraceae bacterium]|nr:GAF domain-containing protein [Usitatibacteraceae bacterium]
MSARPDMAPEGVARIAGYLRAAGLAQVEGHEDEVALAIGDLLEAMGEKVAIDDPGSLYTYPVPMLTADGACSVTDELAPVPYDLTGILGGRGEQATRRLALLERLVERAQETTGSDWVGIYQRRVNPAGHPVLVKLSYVGRPSRAEFPLNREFAAGSTNSTVGLTGRALVIDDVKKHVQAGGGFYVCDGDVQSEACLPLFDDARNVTGIVDAEAIPTSFYGPARLATLVALAIVASAVLP